MNTKDRIANRAGVKVDAQEVARRRLALGLTQDRLAQEADLTTRTIQNLGSRVSNVKTAEALARALGCDVEAITEQEPVAA